MATYITVDGDKTKAEVHTGTIPPDVAVRELNGAAVLEISTVEGDELVVYFHAEGCPSGAVADAVLCALREAARRDGRHVRAVSDPS